MSLRVVLADDHQIMRDGLRALLEQQSGIEVVAEAEDGHAAVALTRKLQPDVVVMDVAMHDLNGIEATRQIKAEMPDVKIIALSMHADKRFVAGMFRVGASGYLLKKGAFHELVQAIRDVAAGQVYLSSKIANVVVEDYVHRLLRESSPDVDVLTSREREVLQLLVEGKTAEQIAAHLQVSVNTVGSHRRHIMKKLDLHSLPELTKYALREGLALALGHATSPGLSEDLERARRMVKTWDLHMGDQEHVEYWVYANTNGHRELFIISEEGVPG